MDNEKKHNQVSTEEKQSTFMEIIRYTAVGVMTTIINWGTTWLLEEFTGVPGWLNSTIAWVVSTVFFAFWAYKIFVFRSRSLEKRLLLREFIEFTAARLVTWGFEAAFIGLFHDILGFDQYLRIGFIRVAEDGAALGQFFFRVKEIYVFKFIATIFVTILNYLFSKLIIFKKNNRRDPDDDSIDR